MMLRKTAILVALICLFAHFLEGPSFSQEIGYSEKYALADDRNVALTELIPGTDEYYYYYCLQAQNTQRYADVEPLVKSWITRHGETARVQEILYRQALLTYPDNPAKSVEFIRSKLNLRFDHQPRRPGQSPQLPMALDAESIAAEVFFNRAIRNRRNLNGFRDSMLADLVAHDDLSAEQQHALLSRLRRPDYDGLVDLLKKDKKGFGSYPVHAQLLKEQLDELAKATPSLLNNAAFIDAYLANLQPGTEVDWLNDLEAREAQLAKIWRFVRRLSPTQNSLKAHVLYHTLATKEQLGDYDRTTFLEYLKLPRRSGIVSREYLQRIGNSQPQAALDADFRKSTLLNRIGNDEPLIRSYLSHFFVDDPDIKAFSEYLQEDYLKRVFAETKIVNGLGDIEKLSASLPPATFKELRERVDIEFAPNSRRIFGRDEAVSLDVTIKNVQKLIVKIYEINALNYYLSEGQELNTNLELDGLTANWQHTFEYDEPPFRRVQRHFDLPELDNAGVYVVDLIGNGRSSRALIRKGQLIAVSRPTAAGQAITVFDENRKVVKDAHVNLGGREFTTGESGYALIPYTTSPSTKAIVIHAGSIASLQTIAHQSEAYDLSAGFYVDRESLLRREKASVLIRPLLTVNGARVSVKALSDVRLEVTTVDLQGITSTKTTEKFELFDDKDSAHEIRTPAHLRDITITLTAKIRQITTSKDQHLVTSGSFSLNGIRSSKKTMNALLTRSAGLYAIDLLGLTGEPLGDLPLQVMIHHRDYTSPVQASIKTAPNGRAVLGVLPGIERVQVTLPDSTTRDWVLRNVEYRYPSTLHALEGRPIDLPYLGNRAEPSRHDFSLLEMRGNRIVADHFTKIKTIGGRIEIRGLPVGDHQLSILPFGRTITVRVTAGVEEQQYLVGQQRVLDAERSRPLFMNSIRVDNDNIKVQLANPSDSTRLHVFATRYLSNETPYGRLSTTPFKELGWVRPARHVTSYVEGRDIGDELRYILDRQYLQKYPGNLLDPPSLLLNPWAVRSTSTGTQDAAGGESFDKSEGANESGARPKSKAGGGKNQGRVSAYLDYLPKTATLLLDVDVDDNGLATIPREALNGKHLVHLVAVDHQWTDYRRLDLDETDWAPVDLRLNESFDVTQHLAQQRRVHALLPGDTLMLREESTSRLQVFDSLSDVYTLYQTLLPQSHIREFNFLVQWHTLSPEQKNSLYKKHASHELHLFLSRRDPAFFQAAVLPLVASKKEKQFLDHYLLGDDLTAYLEPWQYHRLNIMERALLARRHPNQAAATQKHFDDLLRDSPIDRAEMDRLIHTILGMNDSGLGSRDELKTLKSALALDGRMAAPRGGGGRANAALDKARRGQGGGGGGFGGAAFGYANSGQDGAEKSGESKDAKARAAPSRMRSKKSSGRNLPRGLTELAEAESAGITLFRQADATMEWAESHYYRVEHIQQGATLVSMSRFWNDVAKHANEGAMLSTHFPEAARSFTEAASALALLDLPLKGEELDLEFEDGNIVMRNGTAALIVYEESASAEIRSDIPVLASQRFYIDTPEYQQRNSKHDHEYITDEFLTGTVYGCQIVVTNPTAENRELDVLVQVPAGAIPIGDSRATRTIPLDVPAFQTKIVQYSFYFPVIGEFVHYPVHVAHEEKIVAFTDAAKFKVVEEPSKFNTESWSYVSQRGTDEDVLEFLRERPLDDVNLNDILYRLKNRDFYNDLLPVLQNRRIYDGGVWSYSLHHQDDVQIATYLLHADNYTSRCGPILDSPILQLDPIARGGYQHLEYRPLINARTHRLGKNRRILNDRLYGQYHRLLNILSHKNTISDTDRLALVYYLAAQGRTAESLEHFGRVSADKIDMKIQYDFMSAYLDFFAEDPQRARDIVERYRDFPIEHWDEAFTSIRVQLEELDGEGPVIVDDDNRNQRQTVQASTEPMLALKNQGNQVTLSASNVENVQLNFYAMDIEVLFSRNPFVQQYSNKFSFVRPNASQEVELGENQEVQVSIPDDLRKKNVLIEARANGKSSTTTVLANRLNVNVSENFGQVRVMEEGTDKPLNTVYVKVYARDGNGTVRFFKDGYTDLRGRFDYASLSTNQLDQTQRLSILVLSEEHGAVIQEVAPPAR